MATQIDNDTGKYQTFLIFGAVKPKADPSAFFESNFEVLSSISCRQETAEVNPRNKAALVPNCKKSFLFID